MSHDDLGGGNSKILGEFSPRKLGKCSNLRVAYFSDGLKAPTRWNDDSLDKEVFVGKWYTSWKLSHISFPPPRYYWADDVFSFPLRLDMTCHWDVPTGRISKKIFCWVTLYFLSKVVRGFVSTTYVLVFVLCVLYYVWYILEFVRNMVMTVYHRLNVVYWDKRNHPKKR